MDNYIGTRLEGRYDILELIGKGGMANVYRAHDIIDDRTVAVKILRDEYSNNSDFLRRFKNESKAIALLNHPNIVRVYDVSFSDTHSIVMEYIDGVTLKEYMNHTGALPWKDAVHFTIQILHALQHAHDKGIVHRDIKPQNIMLLRTGEIKVTDFGIARFARSESRTISDRAIGSVHYISPEQAMGENTDERSDIYSTGIMLYEMLTGRLPFQADTAVSVAIKQIQTPIEKPSSIVPNIPRGLEEITLKAVQKDSKDRYQSAAEMILALEEFRANPSIRFGYTYPKPGEFSPKQRGPGATSQEKNTMKKKKKSKRKSSYLRMMALVTTAIALGSAGFIGIMILINNPYSKTAEGQIPDLVGVKLSDAVATYDGFIFEEVGHEFRDEYNKGVIFEQKPKPGTTVKLGSTIRIWVSDGKKEIILPDLLDQPGARVSDILRDLGLDPVEERTNHDTVAVGRVISSDPPAGTTLSGGEKVILYISEGPKSRAVSVPNVSGLSLADAKNMITDKEFLVGAVREEVSDLPAGTVIGQSPAAGSLKDQGTEISLIVSKEGLNRYFIPIPLPTNMDRDILIRARVGDGDAPAVAAEETLNPAQSPTGIWSPTFSGEEGEEVRIAIYVDGRLYQEYYLDFDDGSHRITNDRSGAPEFQQ